MSGTLKLNDTIFATENNGAITTDASTIKVGGTTVIDSNRKMTGVDIVPTSSMMFRNKIINGDMRIAQRSTEVQSFSADGGGSGGFKTLDRFYHELGSAGTYTLSQNSITDLAGFKKSLKVLCTTSATPSGTAQFNVHQRIESNYFYDLAFGTSSAKSITYSFWVKTNVAGDFILWFLNVPDQRMTSKKYTVSASETGSWKYISVTVNGDTGGSVFDADNSHAFQVRHVLASGGDYTSGTYMDGTWQTVSGNTGNVYAGQTANVSSAVNNYYEITGVQLEEGTVATPFEHRPISVELSLCQRYFTKSHNSELVPGSSATGGGSVNVFVPTSGTGYFGVYVPFPVEMRNDPTITLYDSANASGNVFKGGDGKSQYIFRKGRRGFSGGTQDATSTNELFFTYTALDEL